MTARSSSGAGGGDGGGEPLALRLRARRAEIAELALLRVMAVAPLPDLVDQEYVQGLRAAVSEAIDYGIAAVACSAGTPPPVPPALLVQARLAARNRVSLDAVQRRYIAGHAVLAEFAIEEMERGGSAERGAVGETARVITRLLDQLVDTVSEEHARESRLQARTAEQRRADAVRRLLGGEMRFASEFAYDFGAHHLGLVAAGSGAAESIRALAKGLDRRLLLVEPAEGSAWGWLEVRGDFDWADLDRLVGLHWPGSATLAAGDLGEGIVGWRRAHEQARAASSLAIRKRGSLVRYGPNSLRIAALNDELLRESLRQMYLVPLSCGRHEGSALQDTLRSYLSTGRNAQSAAAALGVCRRTVGKRVQAAEHLLGETLTKCGSALEVALWLEEAEREESAQRSASTDTDF